MELKKIQQVGGVKQGEYNPTWLKQAGDVPMIGLGCALLAIGTIQYSVGMYRLSNNLGKMD